MASTQEEEKERLFAALYQLDDYTSEDETSLHIHLSECIQQNVPNTAHTPVEPHQNQCASPRSTFLVKQPEPQHHVTTMSNMRRTKPAKLPPPLVTRKSTNRKSMQSLPEGDQIFNGYTFYFIPNDDIAAPRKKRIEKALQYGAVWEKFWQVGITHVVVDSNIAIHDVLKVLHLDRLPVKSSTIHLVPALILCTRIMSLSSTMSGLRRVLATERCAIRLRADFESRVWKHSP